MKRIAIVGLGQIGGSIVLSLRNLKKPYSITGIDTSTKRLKLLEPLLDHCSKHWNATSGSNLTIVCLHYDRTMEFLKQARKSELLLDVCSGKSKIVALANHKRLRFIGGHPMAGNEFAGEKGWRGNLFEHAPFFLCKSRAASAHDLRFIKAFVTDLGAVPVIVDPEKHDRFVAITSHFPAFLSGMLNEMGKKVPEQFHGPGFRSMTRLAKTNPELMNTFLNTNSDPILKTARYMHSLLGNWIQDLTQRRKGAKS
jgi:prephenate dehydrogenase